MGLEGTASLLEPVAIALLPVAAPFCPNEILEAGESASPKEILAKAGVDLASEDFFRYGFGVLQSWLKALP